MNLSLNPNGESNVAATHMAGDRRHVVHGIAARLLSASPAEHAPA